MCRENKTTNEEVIHRARYGEIAKAICSKFGSPKFTENNISEEALEIQKRFMQEKPDV